MKKFVFLIFVVLEMLASTIPAAAQKTFYVYRNDGIINAFLSEDVDSITYSRLDLDSILHETPVVQEVYTPDSIYRIPIEVIDSVGFITPETVYQPGTVNITAEMREYIVDSDSLLLTFASYTPASLLPHVGDKLVNTKASGGLQTGFIGKVRKIENTEKGYNVYCDAIGLTDVFECYYGMFRDNPGTSQAAKARGLGDFNQGKFEWEPGTLTHNLLTTFGSSISYEKDGNALIPTLEDAEISMSLTPKIYGTSFLIVNRQYGVYLGLSIFGDYTLEEYMSLSGSLKAEGKKKFFEKPFPIPEVLCDIDVEIGGFLRSTIEISTEQKWTQRYKSTFHFEWSSKGKEALKNVNEIKNVDNTHSGILALKGSFEGGLYAKVGLAFIATSELDIAEVGLEVEGGLRVEGTLLPYVSNKEDALKTTELYNMMKGKGVEISAYYGTSAYAELFSWSWNKALPNFGNIPFSKKWVIKAYNYVPEFKNTKLKKNGSDYFASVDIVGNAAKNDIGFSLQSKNNPTDRINGYCVRNYIGPSSSAYATFNKTPSKEPYILYPLVKYGELELIADPSAEPEGDPGITFKSAEIIDINADPKYTGDGEYMFTWYTTKFKYIIQIDGSDDIDYVQPIIFDNGAWNYNGGKTRVPGDGLFAVTTSMSYDSDANMNWSTGYEITLKNGKVIYSTNNLKIGGTPAKPTITVTEPATLSKIANLQTKTISDQKQSHPIFEEIEFVKIE